VQTSQSAASSGTNAPAGPPICTREPPSAETKSPPMIAVKIPISGFSPDAIASRHRERQCHDANGESRHRVGAKFLRRITLQRVHQFLAGMKWGNSFTPSEKIPLRLILR